MDNNITEPRRIKQQQTRNLIIGGLVVLMLVYGLYSVLQDRVAPPRAKVKLDHVALATPLSHSDPAAYWLEKAQNQLAEQHQTVQRLNDDLASVKQAKTQEMQVAQTQAHQIEALQTQLALLQQATKKPAASASTDTTAENFPSNTNTDGAATSDGYISEMTLALTPAPNTTSVTPLPTKTPQTFVPAGTFVRAITLGGADASTGVTSQGDPTPMLFRLLEEGTLPNHQHSHLKNCVATAAAIGDISSERGQIRLERISCQAPDGGLVEIPVKATVFGPDGKDGVRGNALWREGALLERAFAAGTLSGFSNGISQSYTSSSLNALGTQTQTVNDGRIMQYGLASGVGNAADKLAEYNIKRAEQYHPVIQLSAGTVVDIVFLKGFYLDGKKHDEATPSLLPPVTMTPPPSITATTMAPPPNTPPTTSPAPLALTPTQIETLKQKNAQEGFN